MDRTLIDAEPAILTIGAATIFFKDGITMKIEDSVQATPADVVQNAGDTWDDLMVKITGTPSGEIETLSTLYPYASFRRGQNIFAADAPCTIKTTSGRLFTIPSAAITKCCDLNLAPDKTFFGGSLEITGVRKNNTAWSAVGSLYTEAASAFADWATFGAAGILKLAYAAAWGALAAPWNGIVTEDGWSLSFGLNLKYQKDAAIGTVQAFYQGETVVAKCRALNVVAADIIAAHPIQGTGAARGKRIASGNNLVLTGDGGTPVITLTSTQLRSPGYRFGNEEIRNGELGFEAQRIYTSGQPQPLYTFA